MRESAIVCRIVPTIDRAGCHETIYGGHLVARHMLLLSKSVVFNETWNTGQLGLIGDKLVISRSYTHFHYNQHKLICMLKIFFLVVSILVFSLLVLIINNNVYIQYVGQ